MVNIWLIYGCLAHLVSFWVSGEQLAKYSHLMEIPNWISLGKITFPSPPALTGTMAKHRDWQPHLLLIGLGPFIDIYRVLNMVLFLRWEWELKFARQEVPAAY